MIGWREGERFEELNGGREGESEEELGEGGRESEGGRQVIG